MEWYRQGKLDEAISASDECMTRVANDLRAIVGAVSDELEVLRRQRRAVIGVLKEPAPTPTEGRTLADAFEVAEDVDTELDRVEASLPRYAATLQRLSDAHHLLAQRARSRAAEKDVDTSLGTLNAAIDDLLDEEWNR